MYICKYNINPNVHNNSQGPAEFSTNDFDGLIKSSHNFFFARKFSLNDSDEIRNHMMAYVADGFYKQMNLETHFSDEIIRYVHLYVIMF